MTLRRMVLTVWVVFFSVVSSMMAAETFPLQVNDVSGLDEPWPLIGGLPFPEGALSDPAQIRIVGADGVETPAQIDVVARWRDGSIRWAQAGLTSSPKGDYRVEFGPGVSRGTPAHPLRIDHDAAGGLSVDTGAAVYAFRPDRLLPETARMGDNVFLADAGDGAYLIDNQGRLARVAGEAAEIETRIAELPSNAQGATRTHDVWLLPRTGAMADSKLKARGLAAAHQPLLQADPAWLGATEAVWSMHPRDTERFSEVEKKMSDYWEDTLPPLRVGKQADAAANLSVFVQVAEALDESTAPEVSVACDGSAVDNVRIVKTQHFQTKNPGRWYPRRWHVALTLPAELAAGNYHLSFSNVDTVVVLESDAPEINLEHTKHKLNGTGRGTR